MTAIIFKCSTTGRSVQELVSAEDANGDAFVPITCLVCGRTHYVKPKTGEVLGINGRR